MVGVGRDLCGSSSPTPLSKEGHLQRAAQDLVQAGLEYLQRRRLHDLPGQPVPVLHHPQTEEVLPRVQMELGPVCSSFSSHKERFCSIPLCNELACPFDYKKTFGKAGRGLSAPMWLSRQHHCTAVNHQPKEKQLLTSRLYIHLWYLVKTSHGWVNGRVGASAEEAKRPSCARGRRVDSKCFALTYPSLSWPWLLPRKELLICCSFQQWR